MTPATGVRSGRPLGPHAQLRRAVGHLRAGRGSTLYDTDGRPYLDFLSGLAVTSLGHAHPVVAEAVATQAGTTQPRLQPVRQCDGPRGRVTFFTGLIGGGV